MARVKALMASRSIMEEIVYDTVVLDALESAGEDLGMVLVH
jgi:hypothetical protein